MKFEYTYEYILVITILKKVFPPHWGGFVSFLTLQLQIAIIRLPMLVVVFFLHQIFSHKSSGNK
jgi:hypothetical protein